MTKQWVFGENYPDEQVAELAKTLNISKGIAVILLRRGITDFKSAKAFFRPQLEDLHDPFLMKDLGKAVNRLSEAIFAGEKILIYGDYDVDGTTSVSLVYRFLRGFSDQLIYYVPDRYKEGYGISEQGVYHAKEMGVSLMIALDCGIRAIHQTRLAGDLGIDLIICDHHLPGDQLPSAYAILDPKQTDCPYPFKELSGCGVGFKLLQGFCLQNTIPLVKLFQQLDLLAVSIASDIVPIIGENRVLAFYGLKKLNTAPSTGLKALMEVGVLKNKLSITNVVFGIGPRINAAGRIGHAKMAVDLLVTDDPEEARTIAAEVNVQNTERKDLDKAMTEEAINMIEESGGQQKHTTVLFKPDWHKGVIGIVASRCIEKYYRPTIILTSSNEVITGSARSVSGFDIHDAIAACEDVLLQYGGHKYAAGLSMAPSQLAAFQEKFEHVVSERLEQEHLFPQLKIDGEVSLSDLTFKFHDVIDQMAPFGPANMKPVFVCRGLTTRRRPRLLKEAHVKMTLTDPVTDKEIDGIAFGFGDMYDDILQANSLDIAFQLDVNEYMGNSSLQLMIKDIKLN